VSATPISVCMTHADGFLTLLLFKSEQPDHSVAVRLGKGASLVG